MNIRKITTVDLRHRDDDTKSKAAVYAYFFQGKVTMRCVLIDKAPPLYAVK
jgi:hypothetical protein